MHLTNNHQYGFTTLTVTSILLTLVAGVLFAGSSMLADESRLTRQQHEAQRVALAAQSQLLALKPYLRVFHATDSPLPPRFDNMLESIHYSPFEHTELIEFAVKSEQHSAHDSITRRRFQRFVQYPLLLTRPSTDITFYPSPSVLSTRLFNSPDIQLLRQYAKYSEEDCSAVDVAAAVLWIAQGKDCTVPVAVSLGTAEMPVILVVEGRLNLQYGSRVHGLVIMVNDDVHSSPAPIELHQNALIFGAVVSISTADATLLSQINYDTAILRQLQTIPQLRKLVAVPGSWRDFQ